MFTFKSLATLAATMAVMTSAVPTAAPATAPDFVALPLNLPAGITPAELAAMALGTNVLACGNTKWNGDCWATFVDHSNCRMFDSVVPL